MNSEQLLSAFSCLDDELIERSEAAKPRVGWRRWSGVAACAAVLAVALLATRGMWRRPAAQVPSAAQFASGYTPAPGETDVVTEPAKHEPAEDRSNAPVKQDEGDAAPSVNGAALMLPDSVGSKLDNVTPMIESYKTDADACYVAPKNGEVNRSLPLRSAMEEYGESVRYRVVVDLFRDEQPLAADSAEAERERERLAALGYTVAYEQVFDHGQPEAAYFTLHATRDELNALPAGAYGYMLFLYGERVQSAKNVPEVVFYGTSAPSDGAEIAVSPRDTAETLTAAEARSDAAFGAYLCHKPAGFDEQEFLRTSEQLRASYRRGYEYVDWSVRAFGEADRERLVTDVAETEKYDVSLYTIPYADSVPAELRSVFYDPIFRVEDLTLELVRARAYRVDEQGDSDGWRASFSVRCGDVLVRVSAKGVSPDWLYQELVSLV